MSSPKNSTPFVSQTQPSAGQTSRAPGYAYPLLRDSLMRVRIYQRTATPQTVSVFTVIRKPSGENIPHRYDLLTGINGAMTEFGFPLAEGELVSVAAQMTFGTIDIQGGDIYIEATVGRGVLPLVGGALTNFVRFATLFADYLTNICPCTWPGSAILSDPRQRPGALLIENPANPGAGVESVYTLGINRYKLVRSLIFTLTTAVAAANRGLTIRYRNPGVTYAQIVIGLQTASLTRTYTLALGEGQLISEFVGSVNQSQSLPQLYMRSLHVLDTRTANLQPADAFTSIALESEEWTFPDIVTP